MVSQLKGSREHTSLDFAKNAEVNIIESEVVLLDLDLNTPMKLPFGTVTSRPSGVVKLDVEVNGLLVTGYGEGVTLPRPLFTDDSGQSIVTAGKFIVDEISGVTDFNEIIWTIQNLQFPDGKLYPTARMMVEMAVLDAMAKSRNVSVATLIGVSPEITSVAYGKSIGEGAIETVLQEVKTALEMGAKKIKLKVSPDSYNKVVNVISEIRKLGDFEIMVDANGTFNPMDPHHLEMLRGLDSQGLLMIEEPVSRVGDLKGIEAVKELRNKTELKTPICLDDCLKTDEDISQAINNGLADVINIKPGRIGSIVKSLELADLCKQKGIEIMVGGMFEATPGRYMTTTVAAYFRSRGFKIPGDISLPQERIVNDIVKPERYLQYNNAGEVVFKRDIPGWGFGQIDLS